MSKDTKATVPTSTAVAAPIPEGMLSRGREATENPMNLIHSLKIYNAPPNGVADPELAGKFMIRVPGSDAYVPFEETSFEVNILKVRQGLSGQYFVLNEDGQKIPEGESYKTDFAFTEEYPAKYFANSNKVFFKSNNKSIQIELGQLKTMLKTPTINGNKNPFYKIGLTQINDQYDSSFITQRFTVYGVFRSGPYAGELFRMLLTKNSFGVTYDDGKVVDPKIGTIEDAIIVASKAFNDYKKANGIKGTFDDSLIRTTMKVTEDGKFFRLNCTNTCLETVDNTEDFDMLNQIMEEHKMVTFGSNQGSYASIVPMVETPTVKAAIEQPTQVQQAPTPQVESVAPKAQQPDPVVNQAPVKSSVDKIREQEEISIEDLPF